MLMGPWGHQRALSWYWWAFCQTLRLNRRLFQDFWRSVFLAEELANHLFSYTKLEFYQRCKPGFQDPMVWAEACWLHQTSSLVGSSSNANPLKYPHRLNLLPLQQPKLGMLSRSRAQLRNLQSLNAAALQLPRKGLEWYLSPLQLQDRFQFL